MLGPLSRIATFRALRYRNYRLYWVGLLVAILGWQVLTFTELWLVYQLTESPLYLGMAGGVNGAANMCLGLFGGVFADRVDKRLLLLVTTSTMAVLAVVLATLTVTHLVTVWHVLIVSALTGATAAFDSPARQALVPHLVEAPGHVANAVALAASVWSASRVVGPALAGVLIPIAGPAICFYVTAATYTVMAISLTQLKVAKTAAPAAPSHVFGEFREGWRYVLNNGVFFNLIAMTFLNSIFGMSFAYLLPVFAQDILAVGATGYGFLMTASGIGAVGGVLTVASIRSEHRGWQLLLGGALFGTLLVAFAVSRWYPLSMLLVAAAGFFNSIYITNVLTLLQSLVPDSLRGRVMGIYALTWGLMPLGGLQAGVVADFLGAPAAVAIGGIIIVGFALFAAISSRQIRSLV